MIVMWKHTESHKQLDKIFHHRFNVRFFRARTGLTVQIDYRKLHDTGIYRY